MGSAPAHSWLHLGLQSLAQGSVLVTQLCPTLCDPMDCSPPGSSVYRIPQARILEWVAISFSRLFSDNSSSPTRNTLTQWRAPERAQDGVFTRSRLEPWARGPGGPLQPAVGAAGAAGACSGPGVGPRPTGAGTHARGPGLPAHGEARHLLRRKGSRAAGAESGWGWPGTSNP